MQSFGKEVQNQLVGGTWDLAEKEPEEPYDYSPEDDEEEDEEDDDVGED
jgi:hypothetical protein